MMPHISVSPRAQKAFDSAITAGFGPYVACQKAFASGAYVDEQYLRDNRLISVTQRLEDLNVAGQVDRANAFRHDNQNAWRQEQLAIKFCESRREMARTLDADAKQRDLIAEQESNRLREREVYAARVGALAYEAWLSAQREEFVERARHEFDLERPPFVFEAPQPAVASTAKSRRRA